MDQAKAYPEIMLELRTKATYLKKQFQQLKQKSTQKQM